MSIARLQQTAGMMNEAVEDSLVANYEGLIPAIDLPDENARHVVAAVIAGRVDVIVTANLKDFPDHALAPYGIMAQLPHVFIRHALDLDETAIAAVRACRASLKNPGRSVDEYLASLAQQGPAETVSYLAVEWREFI